MIESIFQYIVRLRDFSKNLPVVGQSQINKNKKKVSKIDRSQTQLKQMNR